MVRVQIGRQTPVHPGELHKLCLAQGMVRPRAIGRTTGGLNSKLHVVCDGLGRPPTFFVSPGQMSAAKGALALLSDLPPAKRQLAERGYDAYWFREALERWGIAACIPLGVGKKSREP